MRTSIRVAMVRLMRCVVILVLAMALSGCGRNGDTAPFTASRLPPGAPVSAWPPPGWAWGLLKIGDQPALRYGVSSPAGAPAGNVVILPGYGESAEWWFETARDLSGDGFTVWILEGTGQGGSARLVGPRDLGHLKDFNGDIEGLAALIKEVIRPPPNVPVRLIASGTSAITALAAVEQGLPIRQLILSAPNELKPSLGGLPAAAGSVGLRSLRASGEHGWSRPDSAARLTRREKIARGWAVANPDLRMGGPSAGWLMARKRLRDETLRPEALSKVKAPTVLIAPGDPDALCQAAPACVHRPLPASRPYHVGENAERGPWIAAITADLADHAE